MFLTRFEQCIRHIWAMIRPPAYRESLRPRLSSMCERLSKSQKTCERRSIVPQGFMVMYGHQASMLQADMHHWHAHKPSNLAETFCFFRNTSNLFLRSAWGACWVVRLYWFGRNTITISSLPGPEWRFLVGSLTKIVWKGGMFQPLGGLKGMLLTIFDPFFLPQNVCWEHWKHSCWHWNQKKLDKFYQEQFCKSTPVLSKNHMYSIWGSISWSHHWLDCLFPHNLI